MATDVERAPRRDGFRIPGLGLLKGLAVTLKTLLSRSVTQQYPREKPELPPRTRGVIALKPENCTVCWKCSRECPDWCIYIESHKETHDPASGGRARSAKVLDRFAIDYALCMYCGICVEVCPFDALFWSPEFDYPEYGIQELTHEKEKLQDWTYTVLPPPELESGAEPGIPEVEEPAAPTSAAPIAAPGGAAAPAVAPSPAREPPPAPVTLGAPAGEGATAPAEEAAGTPAGGEETGRTPPGATPATSHGKEEPDQETYERVLAEQLEKGVDRRVAEGRAKRAAIKAAREMGGEAAAGGTGAKG